MFIAYVKKYKSGKHEGKFRFVLKSNGKVVATSGTQKYEQEHSAIDTIKSCFPNYKIIGLENTVLHEPTMP